MKGSEGFKEFVLDQLHGLESVRAQRMFGGHGLYQNNAFFGILHRGRLFFKVHQSTREEYERLGMKAFEPKSGQIMKGFLEVPPEIIEDSRRLVDWAKAALGQI